MKSFKNILFLVPIFFSSVLQAQCYQLVWEDAFDGNALNLDNWEYAIGPNFANNELQYYTGGDNLTVSGGTLQIIGKEDLADEYAGYDYTSTRIRSRFKGDWRYGKMEASIKLPFGQGIWPAFWMMPSESVYGIWPASGEIDIMEYLGHQQDKVYATAHYGNLWNDKSSSGSSFTLTSGNFPDQFHTFGIEWEPGEIRWYLDGILYHTLTDSHPDFNTYNWPFDQEFHFILNVAIGGNWPGNPDASTSFPQTMEVDWVRVYQELPDIAIKGDVTVLTGSTQTKYTLPNIAGATYDWSVPSNTLIVAGENTHEITLNWGNTSGPVSATTTTACGTETYSLGVTVSTNLWLNHNFEAQDAHWNTNSFNGANADFDVVNTDVQEGNYAMCVTPTNLGPNPWDIQLGRSNIELIAGEEYTLRFWAKADVSGKDANFAFINSETFELYHSGSFILTDQWAAYETIFVAPNTANCLFNLDLGDETGTCCFDDFFFSAIDFIDLAFDGKILLEGAYETNGQMNTDLQNWIPLTQPYNNAPYNYLGTENVSTIPATMVDWVLVEARLGVPNLSGSRGTLTLASLAGILLDDGSIVGTDGNPLVFPNLIEGEDYHFCIRHRNHLDVISSVAITAAPNIAYDFTTNTNQAFGINQLGLSTDGYPVMYAGDFNQDGSIQVTDFDAWAINPAVLNTYQETDANLDGTIQVSDYDVWFPNKAKLGSVEIGF